MKSKTFSRFLNRIKHYPTAAPGPVRSDNEPPPALLQKDNSTMSITTRDLFDFGYYHEQNFDVAGGYSNENRFRGCFEHYKNFGIRERRNPNALFYSEWYAQQHGLKTEDDPLEHFIEHEETGAVSPNPFWHAIKSKTNTPAPKLKDIFDGLYHQHKPTYIVGLYGTGRLYINQLILHHSGTLGYFHLDGLKYQTQGTPIIWSGHTTIKSDNIAGHSGAAFGQSLLDLAEANLANIIFIYRHPIDSLLTNWAWWREYAAKNKFISGIAGNYRDEAQFYSDLDRNFFEFALFCSGSSDFMDMYGLKLPPFFSLSSFVSESIEFLNHNSVRAFKFEDFTLNSRKQFSRLLSVIDPEAKLTDSEIPRPNSSKDRYIGAMNQVPAFKTLIHTLPDEIKTKISQMGYDI